MYTVIDRVFKSDGAVWLKMRTLETGNEFWFRFY